MQQILELIDRFGVSVVMLTVFILGSWNVLRWLAPRFDMLITRHTSFMDKIESQGESHVTILRELSAESQRHGERLDEHGQELQKIREGLTGVCHNYTPRTR